MPQPELRVGSGFSALYFAGQPIAWLQGFTDSGQSVGANGSPQQEYEAVYELSNAIRRPKEIVQGDLLGAGTITATIKEMWNRHVWEHLAGLEGAQTVHQVYDRLRNRRDRMTAQKVIRIPGTNQVRGKTYHGVIVVGVPDGETISLGTLTLDRQVTLVYTHYTPLTSPPVPTT